MHTHGRENLNPSDEEALAEKAREKFVSEFHQTVNEQLLEEADEDKEGKDKTEKDANTDSLTGLLNRRGFESALAEIRKERKTGALLMLDVDHFKEVNDTYGHSIGDMALKVIAKNLISMCRDSDLVVRWGGEEFILFFPETPADQVLKKFTPEGSDKAMINFQFKRSSDPKAHKIEVTFSGGITNLEPGDNLDDAIGKVDETLYAIKNGGRNELKLAPMASPAE